MVAPACLYLEAELGDQADGALASILTVIE